MLEYFEDSIDQKNDDIGKCVCVKLEYGNQSSFINGIFIGENSEHFIIKDSKNKVIYINKDKIVYHTFARKI